MFHNVITDARTHAGQLKLSDSDILFLHNTIPTYPPPGKGLTLVRLDDRKLEVVTQQETNPKKVHIKCTCEGVVLLTNDRENSTYTLWNPTTASKTSVVPCPYAFRRSTREGICYDPITNDIKVVVVAWGYYTVYSRNNKSWTNVGKQVPRCFRERVDNVSPVTADGAVYWAENHTGEIIYFDPTWNEFKALRMPENVEKGFRLVCLGGHLCLWSWYGDSERGVRIWIKARGKDADSWQELLTIKNQEMLQKAITRFEPLCFVGHKIVIRLDSGVIVAYSPCEDTFEAILVKDSSYKIPEYGPLVPYVQSQLVLDSIMKRIESIHIS